MNQATNSEENPNYVKKNPHKLPENMQPWDDLRDIYKRANLEQAAYSVAILKAAGFKVGPPRGRSVVVFKDFKRNEIEKMARLEHGRWNVERLRSGIRYGPQRDDQRRIHNLIVRWDDQVLADYRRFDYNSVKAFPEILAKAGLEITRIKAKKPAARAIFRRP